MFKCNQDDIVNFAFNYGSILKKSRTWIHIKSCNNCREAFNNYKQVAKALKDLSRFDCPDHIIKKIEQITGENQTSKSSFIEDLIEIFATVRLKRALAGSLLVIFVLVGVIFYRNPNEHQQRFSQKEINKARTDAEKTLAMLGGILNSTTTKLKEEVLVKNISKPLKKSLNTIDELFQQEKTK